MTAQNHSPAPLSFVLGDAYLQSESPKKMQSTSNRNRAIREKQFRAIETELPALHSKLAAMRQSRDQLRIEVQQANDRVAALRAQAVARGMLTPQAEILLDAFSYPAKQQHAIAAAGASE